MLVSSGIGGMSLANAMLNCTAYTPEVIQGQRGNKNTFRPHLEPWQVKKKK